MTFPIRAHQRAMKRHSTHAVAAFARCEVRLPENNNSAELHIEVTHDDGSTMRVIVSADVMNELETAVRMLRTTLE